MGDSTTTTTPSDDVVGEVLLRLDDVATLFRCAITCKRWRRLVAEPYFILRRKWPPSLVGFFTRRCLGGGAGTTTATDCSTQLACVPWPGSTLLGTRPRALSSFLRADDAAAAAVVDAATPLATRGGLLLVRLYLRLRDDELKPKTFCLAPVSNPIVGLAVCNPFAGTWDVLPELDCQSRLSSSIDYGCDILPSIARDGSPGFKVKMIGKDKDKAQYNLHTFVSGEESWRAPTKCFDMMEHQIWSMEDRKAIVCRGYAHWLFISELNQFHVLNVEIETGHVSLTKLVSPRKDCFIKSNIDDYEAALAHNQRLLDDLRYANCLQTTSNGACLSLCTYRDRRLEIWTRHQEDGNKSGDGDAEWRHTREIDHKLTELIQKLEKPSCIWSAERSGTLLINERILERKSLYIAHLDTGTLEEATDQFCDYARNGIMPMEIDWPTFFMSCLNRVK
jgi:hypothetical protein